MAVENCNCMFGSMMVDCSPHCHTDAASSSFSPVDLIDLLHCTVDNEESPRKTTLKTSFEQVTNAEYLPVHNHTVSVSSCPPISVVSATEIARMLRILRDIRTAFPFWASYEQNWCVHKSQILHLGGIDGAIREGYRAAFQLIADDEIGNEASRNIHALEDLIECLDLLKMPTPSGTIHHTPLRSHRADEQQISSCDSWLPTSENAKFSLEDVGTKISLDALGYAETVKHQLNVPAFDVDFKLSDIQSLCTNSNNNNLYSCRPKRERKKTARYMNSLEYTTPAMATASPVPERNSPASRTSATEGVVDKIISGKLTTATNTGSDRSLPPEFQSGIKGVVWNRHRQVWEATWKSANGKRCWVSFRADKYGFEEAKRLAVGYRIKHSTDPIDKALLKRAEQQNAEGINEANCHSQHNSSDSNEQEVKEQATQNTWVEQNGGCSTTSSTSTAGAEDCLSNFTQTGPLKFHKQQVYHERKYFSYSSSDDQSTHQQKAAAVSQSSYEQHSGTQSNSSTSLNGLDDKNNNDSSETASSAACASVSCEAAITDKTKHNKIVARGVRKGKTGKKHENIETPILRDGIKTEGAASTSTSVMTAIKCEPDSSAARPMCRSNTGILGVCRDNLGRWYTAHMTVNGKRKFVRFMTSDIGEKEAMERAIKARRKMENGEYPVSKSDPSVLEISLSDGEFRSQIEEAQAGQVTLSPSTFEGIGHKEYFQYDVVSSSNATTAIETEFDETAEIQKGMDKCSSLTMSTEAF